MPNGVWEVASFPLAAGQYNVSINGATTITVPTSAQGRPVSLGTQQAKGGELTMFLSVETQNARFTLDGTTPTTTNGVLLQAPGFFTLRGKSNIANFKIIGVAAGGIINYGFTVDDIN